MLTRLHGPVRSLATHDDLRPDNHPINAPREIMRLINYMMSGTGHLVRRFWFETMIYWYAVLGWSLRLVHRRKNHTYHSWSEFSYFLLIPWFSNTTSVLIREKSSPFRRVTMSRMSRRILAWRFLSCWIHCRNQLCQHRYISNVHWWRAVMKPSRFVASISSVLGCDMMMLLISFSMPSHHILSMWVMALTSCDMIQRVTAHSGVDICDGVPALYMSILKISIRRGWENWYVVLQWLAMKDDLECNMVTATIFAPVLLRDDPEFIHPPVSPLGKRNFLFYFIRWCHTCSLCYRWSGISLLLFRSPHYQLRTFSPILAWASLSILYALQKHHYQVFENVYNNSNDLFNGPGHLDMSFDDGSDYSTRPWSFLDLRWVILWRTLPSVPCIDLWSYSASSP